MPNVNISASEIQAIESRIRPYIRRTPVLEVCGSEFGLEKCKLVFKLESCQHSGSFKARGAFANLLTRSIPTAGVVAASGGNHGVAVAYAAWKLGIAAKIFVPAVASPSKIERIRGFDADLTIVGDRYADALGASEVWARGAGALPIHAYDQKETLLGQGTLGFELEHQARDLDTLLVAVGGGGLIGGVAAWFSSRVRSGSIRIVGVEPETAPTLTYALRAGRPVDAPAGGIAADSLAPRQVGKLTLPLAQKYVAEVLLVSDQAIYQAQKKLWSALRIAAEPGGAAAFAALLSGTYSPRAKERVGIVICGGNTAVDFISPTDTLDQEQLISRKVT